MSKSYDVMNNGMRSQAIQVDGWPKVINPGKSIVVENFELTEVLEAHYKARGVTFSKPDKNSSGKKSTKTDAKAKAAEELAAAQAVVDTAKVALAAAGDDLEKQATAAKALEDAEAALAALSSDAS